MDEKEASHTRAFSAFGYAARIAVLVILTETLIMVLLGYLQVSRVASAAIDTSLLTLILIPSIYAWVYRPLSREVALRHEAGLKLADANAKINEYARSLEGKIEEKIRELKSTYAQYKALLETSNDMIIVADSTRRIIFWNRVAETSFGYAREEAVGRDVSMIVPEMYRVAHLKGFAEFMATGAMKSGGLHEVEGLRKDGTLFPVELSLSSYSVGDNVFVMAILRDITGRKKTEAQIKDHLERLKALRNIDMAINASLDLRLTLNVILDQMASTLKADAADILLFNNDTTRLEFHAGKGFYTDALKETRLKIGEGHAGRAAFDGKLLCIRDLRASSDDFARAPFFKAEGFVSYCAVPLVSKGALKGVLEAFSRSERTPPPDYYDFMEAIALQAAIAIDNASLFNNLYRANMELSMAYETTLEGWSNALDLRDKETEGHSQRVTEMTVRIARAMGISGEDLVHVRRGALLHDIGKMGIPDSILLKPGPLDPDEMEIMKKHPVYAYDLLSPIHYLRPALDIPLCHHEKWDGSGYPRGLKGADIPLSARIFTLVDIWDALHSDRPYRKAWDDERIREHVKSLAGKDLDPKVVEVFFSSDW
ncbi:MAG: PAS domain S-box protein [Deltaproteobacteria bacterium]|nr:PAS domain S-box protein [Deltaproteobacteria bacterium]